MLSKLKLGKGSGGGGSSAGAGAGASAAAEGEEGAEEGGEVSFWGRWGCPVCFALDTLLLTLLFSLFLAISTGGGIRRGR